MRKCVILPYFNSIKVRLRRAAGLNPDLMYSQFQFHKGTIETNIVFQHSVCSIKYFNSIKVRLRPSYSADYSGIAKFQFHKGTIETNMFIIV